MTNTVGILGVVRVCLYGPDGELIDERVTSNLITQHGDQYYAERAAGIGSPPAQITGMKLGTGTTAVAKSGAGAHIVTYTSAKTCSKAIDGGYPTSSGIGTGTTITFVTTWAAGEATVNALAEVVLSNETSLADTAGTEANTLARALLSPTINKAAGDTLAVTWTHTVLGA